MPLIRRHLPLDRPALSIVCTAGPSVFQAETSPGGHSRIKLNRLPELLSAGMRVIRINFSHVRPDRYEEIKLLIQAVREIEGKERIPIPIMMDLQGPELRISRIRSQRGKGPAKKLNAKTGDTFRFSVEADEAHRLGRGVKGLVVVRFDGDFYKETGIGHRVVVGDNDLYLEVKRKESHGVICVAKSRGVLEPGNSINLPHKTSLAVEALVQEDLDALEEGFDVDLIAQSLVQDPGDVKELVGFLRGTKQRVDDLRIIAKIETPRAVEKIDEILRLRRLFGIMVARGDLGVLTDYIKIPKVQRELIEKANRLGKPVIVATQMLESMIERPRPWRPEVQDTTTAIEEGADGLMLSGETAKGEFPIDAVRVMAEVISENSPVDRDEYLSKFHEKYALPRVQRPIDTIGYAICEVAKEARAPFILSYATQGTSAMMISRFRPEMPILAITINERTARFLTLLYNVYPVLVAVEELPRQPREFINFMQQVVKELGLEQLAKSKFRGKRRFLVATQEINSIVDCDQASGIFVFDPA